MSSVPEIFDESNLAVVYCGEETSYRAKPSGHTIIDQLILSATSLRKNWSSTVPVLFLHAGPLRDATVQQLYDLRVETQQCSCVDPRYPIANKMLVGQYAGPKHILFMDCDTIVHRPVYVPNPTGADLLIAPDVMPSLDETTFREVFTEIGAPPLEGEFVDSPALAYYAEDRTDLFPNWNAGMYVVERSTLAPLTNAYLRYLAPLIAKYGREEWAFFIDQICFTAAALSAARSVAFLPKGMNYICTPRADALAWWPKHDIIVEHYAGDTSTPSLRLIDLQ